MMFMIAIVQKVKRGQGGVLSQSIECYERGLTIEIEKEEDGGDEVRDEGDEEVDDSLSEEKLPERRSAGRVDETSGRKNQNDQIK